MSSPLRIAIVDDEASVRGALQRLLRSAGMDVETFRSGEEFLARSGAPIDCLVIDVNMPGMDGFQVHEQLRRDGHFLPVVVMTGHDKPEYRSRARDLGVRAFISKPMSGEDLIRAIEAATAR